MYMGDLMNQIYEMLFDGYAEPLLGKDHDIASLLAPLPIPDSLRLELDDTLNALRLQWATDAFIVGLHLGLSLLHDNVRRSGSQQLEKRLGRQLHLGADLPSRDADGVK